MERLVVISDMWGAKKGVWATSYLAYLQQYFNVTYYDSQQLAKLEACIDCTDRRLKDAFDRGGIGTATGQLIQMEEEPAHYLAFGVGGEIAWKAGLQGLPIKSLYAVSVHGLPFERQGPNIPIRLVYGEHDEDVPPHGKIYGSNIHVEVIHKVGAGLYTDDRIIKKIAKDLLSLATHKMDATDKVAQIKKPLLVS